MQVLCVMTTDDQYDVQCPGCGQRYRVFYSRLGKTECEEALQAVRAALAEHHLRGSVVGAHPGEAFNVPAWHGPAHASAAALLSGAPLVPQPRTRPALTLVPNAAQRRVS